MRSEEIRRWVENFRAAAEKERAWARENRLSPSESLAAAMFLLNLDESWNGDPFARRDRTSEREDTEAIEAWRRLREGWPGDR